MKPDRSSPAGASVRRLAALAAVATLLTAAPLCAGFGSIVFDPINHLETAVSAAQSVHQTALQVRAEIQRLQQLAIELQQLKALPGETVRSTLADWGGQLAALESVAGELAGIDSQLYDSQQRSAAALREIAALGLSPRTWLLHEVELAGRRQQGAEALFAAERQSLATLTRSRLALAGLQAQIPASSGIQQSMQTTNQYLDLLAGQSTQLLQLGAAQAADQARQRSLQQADAALADAREAQRTSQDLDDIARLRARLRAQESAQGWGILRPLPDPVPDPRP